MKPINRVAARVLQRGEHWTPTNQTQNIESDNPFPVVPEGMIGENNLHSLPNLTGIQRGRLIAFGFSVEYGRWSCRCQCGRYVLRSTRAMNNDKNVADACSQCRELMFLKREEHYRRTGRDTDIENYV